MPAVLIDFEGNTDSIESKCNYIPGINREALAELKARNLRGEYCPDGKIDVIRLKCKDRFGVAGHIEDFTGIDAFNETLNYLLDYKHEYKSSIVDSWTAFDYWAMAWIMKNFPVKRVHPEIPDKPDYRKLLLLHNDLFYALIDAQFHTFITCHTYLEDKDEIIRPRLSGQARTSISGIFKQVGVLTALGGKRELRFQPYGRYHAKDCSEGGTMGIKIENPTLRKIYDLRYNTGAKI